MVVPVYYQSNTSFKPPAVEIQKSTAYIRKNFKEIISTITDADGQNPETFTSWSYEEAKMSVPEFNEYVSLISSQNAINGVNDSSNITSILSGQQVNDFNQLAIMEAIVELFEMLTTMQTSTT